VHVERVAPRIEIANHVSLSSVGEVLTSVGPARQRVESRTGEVAAGGEGGSCRRLSAMCMAPPNKS